MKKFLFIILIALVNTVYAAESYKVDKSEITTVNEHEICKKIEVKDNNIYFIPTKTKKEWENFIAHTPKNIVLSDCKKLSYTFPDIDYSRAHNDYGPEINKTLNDNNDGFHAGFHNTYNAPNEYGFAILDEEGKVTIWWFDLPPSMPMIFATEKYTKLYSGQHVFYAVTENGEKVERIAPMITGDVQTIKWYFSDRGKKVKKVYTNFWGQWCDINRLCDYTNDIDDVIVLYEDGKIECSLLSIRRDRHQNISWPVCFAKNKRGKDDKYYDAGENGFEGKFLRADILRVFPTRDSFILINKNEKLEDAFIEQLSLFFIEYFNASDYTTLFDILPKFAQKKVYVTSSQKMSPSSEQSTSSSSSEWFFQTSNYWVNFSFVGVKSLDNGLFYPAYSWLLHPEEYKAYPNQLPKWWWESMYYGNSRMPEGVGVLVYKNCVYNQSLNLLSNNRAWGFYYSQYTFFPEPKDCPQSTEFAIKYAHTNGKAIIGIKYDSTLTCLAKKDKACKNTPKDAGYTKIFSNQYGFVGLKADGSVKCFSVDDETDYPLPICENTPKDKGYTNIYSSKYGFAAMKADGSIKSWGFGSPGINYNPPKDKGYKDIRTNATSFVAVKEDGTMACWGHPRFGWTCPKLNQDTKKKK